MGWLFGWVDGWVGVPGGWVAFLVASRGVEAILANVYTVLFGQICFVKLGCVLCLVPNECVEGIEDYTQCVLRAATWC